MTDIRIGISGWRYASWRGDFYPSGLPQRKELQFASRALNSIELNGSFYSLQRPESYASWYADTPADFVFSLKGPRYLTHILRLRELERPIANFLASGVFNLREKLGPILWQFPANFPFTPELFEKFLRALPHDTETALSIAMGCEARMEGRSCLTIDCNRPLRHAVEIRHRSFVDPLFVEMLRAHGVALVVADTAGKWPWYEDLTADFVYIRLHGAEELYTSGYSDEELDVWSRRIRLWTQGTQPDDARLIDPRDPPFRQARDLYCYFDNDARGRAPYDARVLLNRLGLEEGLQATPGRLEGALP